MSMEEVNFSSFCLSCWEDQKPSVGMDTLNWAVIYMDPCHSPKCLQSWPSITIPPWLQDLSPGWCSSLACSSDSNLISINLFLQTTIKLWYNYHLHLWCHSTMYNFLEFSHHPQNKAHLKPSVPSLVCCSRPSLILLSYLVLTSMHSSG